MHESIVEGLTAVSIILSLDEYLNSAPKPLELQESPTTQRPGMRARYADVMRDRKVVRQMGELMPAWSLGVP
jgi:hypothetical protein